MFAAIRHLGVSSLMRFDQHVQIHKHICYGKTLESNKCHRRPYKKMSANPSITIIACNDEFRSPRVEIPFCGAHSSHSAETGGQNYKDCKSPQPSSKPSLSMCKISFRSLNVVHSTWFVNSVLSLKQEYLILKKRQVWASSWPRRSAGTDTVIRAVRVRRLVVCLHVGGTLGWGYKSSIYISSSKNR